jgi:tetratricopeptide (TPR) repeat protein
VNGQRLGAYDILSELGHGGMGVVYRANDRLSGKPVALKRILTVTHEADATSFGHSSELRVSLAKEFQVLASLHHPNIINVLDYGFDGKGQPYFVMSLLDQPRTLVEAARNQPLARQMGLVVDVLQALAYLHRHDIVHRDLKPGNVLVTADGVVKVLDFGLAVPVGQDVESAGTVFYIAPEVLAGGLATQPSDLYAVGVMIFEILAGRRPFEITDTSDIFHDILNRTPDTDSLDVSDPLKAVIVKLLAKNPAHRYQEAYEVIRELCAAIGQPAPPESEAIRQSFLEAAQFVGRETELDQLLAALSGAMEGRGSSWLVGGESGIGKSRLLDELRTQALVSGALLLRGQAVAQGGLPYQAWVDVVRRLVVTTDISDLEASVLKAILPDIGALIGRDVPDAPEVDASAGQQRLSLAVLDLITRQPEPVLLLLEDLHWASESLDILRALNRMVDEARLLIVASYRNDERPDLPDEMPSMKIITLGRLPQPSIVELATSMIGEGGRQRQILDLLQRETEGNVFFLVEVLRALAEEAGSLGGIVGMALPERVMAGGVQQIVRRRLARAPLAAQPLLRLAAVAGRQLDLKVLETLIQALPQLQAMPLDAWLTACANAAVLERQGAIWRFAHDKLREALVADLPAEQRPGLHRQVAEALERLYPNDDAQAAILMEHWHQAGDSAKEAYYAGRAGIGAAARYAHQEALGYLDRALKLLPEGATEARYQLLMTRVQIAHIQGLREIQARDLDSLYTLADQLQDDRRRAEVRVQRAALLGVTGDSADAITAAQEAVRLAQAVGAAALEVEAYIEWGTALWKLSDYAASRAQFELLLPKTEAFPHLKAYSLRHLSVVAARQGEPEASENFSQQALVIFQALGDPIGESTILRGLGAAHYVRGDFARARDFNLQAIRRFHETGDRLGESVVYNNMGIMADDQGDYVGARQYVEMSLAIKRQIGERQGEASGLINLGFFAMAQGDFPAAQTYNDQALVILREIGDRQDEANALHNQGVIAAAQGDYAAAETYYQQALAIRRQINDEAGISETLAYASLRRHHLGDLASAEQGLREAVRLAHEVGAQLEEARGLHFLGHVLQAQERLTEAEEAYRQALALREALGQTHLAVETRAGIAEIALAQGRVGEALTQINAVMQHLTIRTADGLDEPLRLCLTCYRVLKSLGDARAANMLDATYQFLLNRSTKITDDRLRMSFLEHVPAHRDVVAAWNARGSDGA